VIKSYRIYRDESGKYVKEAETGDEKYTLSDIDSESVNNYVIRSVDDRGDESDNSYTVTTREWGIEIMAGPSIIFPQGEMGKILGTGYGGLARLSYRNFFIYGLDLGFDAGYWSFGKKERLRYAKMYPAFFSLKYRFKLLRNFYIGPRLCGGLVYESISHDVSDKVYYPQVGSPVYEPTRYETVKGLNPLAIAEMNISYTTLNFVHLQAGAGYGAIFEKSAQQRFITAYFSAGIKLWR